MEPPEDEVEFPFPFPPYDIQQQFMRSLYGALRDRKLGIFESPTGTGKSLSMCCGALQWLKLHEEAEIKSLEAEIARVKSELAEMPESEDWLESEYNKIKKTQELNTFITKLTTIKQRIAKYEEMKVRVSKDKNNINTKSANAFNSTWHRTGSKHGEEKENSADIGGNDVVGGGDDTDGGGDEDLLLEELERDDNEQELEDDKKEEQDDHIKICIASRTHSQLSQLVGEIRRTAFASSTRVVTLASRRHYCINHDVSRLKSLQLINERCLDLQKSKSKPTAISEEGKALKKAKTKACSSCPYYNQGNITRLKERMLVQVMDMEDLVKSGKELKACPYYASRAAVSDAQVVLASHAGIVSSGARSGVSLDLHNNVLLLDEAHGLSSALEAAHSAPLAAPQLAHTHTYLQLYVEKYRDRMSSKNLLTLNQLLYVMRKLLGMMEAKPNEEIKKSDETKIYTVEEFTVAAEMDHMNLRPLVELCCSSRLAPKLHGFSTRYNVQSLQEELKPTTNRTNSLHNFLNSIKKKNTEEPVETKPESAVSSQQVSPAVEGSAGSGLYAVVGLLEMLCSRSALGRVLVTRGHHLAGHTKYLLLDPAAHFASLVTQCRSVILAGGTMEPISEFRSLLGGGSVQDTDDRITVLRCDHVVSPENVLALCLSRGPTNVNFDFRYENRASKELLEEVCRTLRNICGVVPGGVVVFVTSYSYEQTLYEHLKATRAVEHIGRRKKIFREPKNAAQVDQVLSEFAAAVRCRTDGNTGALLFSVAGGKLSEGLNFSDDLGRCVVVVGMPYPNIKSPELQEKMSFLNRTQGPGAGSQYYENLCMKTVNQCIGRAVRHAHDYASVVLLDERYSRPTTAAALPPFLHRSLRTNLNFGGAFSSIVKFFKQRHDNS